MKILFVCTGNTCRSPMAEAYIKKITGQDNYHSAGTDAIEGLSASENSIYTLQELDIELKDHKSKRINHKIIDECDIIITMTLGHKNKVIQVYPNSKNKTYTLKEYVKGINSYELIEKINDLEEKISNQKAPFEKNSETAKELEECYRALYDLDIGDPFGGDLITYKSAFAEIKENIDKLINGNKT